MQKELVVRFNMPGFHFWLNAPEEYSYLKNLHRHIFYWEIKVAVEDSDREYEFIELKDEIMSIVKNLWDYKTGRDHNDCWCELSEDDPSYFQNCEELSLDNALYFGSMSCEMIAEQTKLGCKRELEELRITEISVLEDNENGAIIKWQRE